MPTNLRIHEIDFYYSSEHLVHEYIKKPQYVSNAFLMYINQATIYCHNTCFDKRKKNEQRSSIVINQFI